MTGGGRYGIEVRAALAADAPEVARLMASAAIAVPEPLAERMEAVRAHPTSACLVTTGYDGLSGVIALCWAPVLQAALARAWITLFIVDREERRRGIGRMLLKSASQLARNAGCGAIEMAVPPGSEAAAFCLATGFASAGQLHDRTLRKKA